MQIDNPSPVRLQNMDWNIAILVARAIRNAIRTNGLARIIRNWNPIFMARQTDSHESLKFPIRANHATKIAIFARPSFTRCPELF